VCARVFRAIRRMFIYAGHVIKFYRSMGIQSMITLSTESGRAPSHVYWY